MFTFFAFFSSLLFPLDTGDNATLTFESQWDKGGVDSEKEEKGRERERENEEGEREDEEGEGEDEEDEVGEAFFEVRENEGESSSDLRLKNVSLSVLASGLGQLMK